MQDRHLVKTYLMEYDQLRIEIRQTKDYAKWFDSVRDPLVKGRIEIRIRRLSLGHWGDAKFVGDGLMELRFHFGPGYRLYFIQQGAAFVLLLAGGTKATQENDIQRAHFLARHL
jgi:putative addiction module killer protein